jgi:hypothetical protein
MEHLDFKRHQTRVLFVSIVPPHNDCGGRIVMYRHLVERQPFELHVASNADFAKDILVHTPLRLPHLIQRLKKSRLVHPLWRWIVDYENLIWPLATNRSLEKAIQTFQPDVVLTVADNSLSKLACHLAKRHKLPLAGLFLDWLPNMKGHVGHQWTKSVLSRGFRALYRKCDLAFCTSDGMKEALGPHSNCHVIYPMPGQHRIPKETWPPSNGKFRLVYVGSVENFYGRMICSLIEKMEAAKDLEIIVAGPNADWPAEILQRAKAKGIYVGFKPPEGAAKLLAGADALIVIMSFEPEHRLFMETSFTTKFLDYVAYGKPVILWAPNYCTPVRVVRRDGGAVVVDTPDADKVLSTCREIAGDPVLREKLLGQAKNLHQGLFNPDRLQGIFAGEIEKLAVNWKKNV